MNIGTAIRQIRRQQGLTLQQLCDAVGNDMQTGYLSRIETGKLAPSVYTVADIARALGTTVDNLLNQRDAASGFEEFRDTVACQKIPVYPFYRGSNPFAVTMRPPTIYTRMIPSPVKSPAGSFGLILDDDSMQSSEGLSFSQGSIIIVAPYDYNPIRRKEQIHVGQFVIVHQKNNPPETPPLFRELVSDGTEMMLRPRNARYPIRPLPSDPQFVGYVIAQIIDLT